jgi:hypothetical protein
VEHVTKLNWLAAVASKQHREMGTFGNVRLGFLILRVRGMDDAGVVTLNNIKR